MFVSARNQQELSSEKNLLKIISKDEKFVVNANW